MTDSASSTAPAAGTRTLRGALGTTIALLDRWRRQGDRGVLAELRRLDAARIPPDGFWAVMAATGSPPDQESFWRSLLPLMILAPHAAGPHPGEALQRAGVSAARFERWLRFERADALREARKLIRRLERVDWLRLGVLLHRWDESARIELARHYFGAQHRASTATMTREAQ